MKKYRFVAMLDILGFRDLLKQRGTDVIHQLMIDLFRTTGEGTRRDYTVIINGRIYRHPAVRLDYFIFSDTILIWKDYQDVKEGEESIEGHCDLFREFNHGVSMVLERALLSRIPLRGGIAFGVTIINIDRQGVNNEIIGQPIVDAYLVGEAQNWVGVTFHSSCLPFIEGGCDPTVIEYNDIPYYEERLKLINNGKETSYSLKWCGNIKEMLNKIIKELEDNNTSEHILEKYKEAIKFCRNHEVIL